MNRSLGLTVLQIGLALFLIVAGVIGIVRITAGELSPIVTVLNSLLQNSTIITLIIIVLAVMQLVAGVFLLIELFSPAKGITSIILIVFMIMWVANIILVDIIGAIRGNILANMTTFLQYLEQVSSHLLVLGAVLAVRRRF